MESPPPPSPFRLLRLVAVGAGGVAVYITLAAWAYTAATVGDVIGAGALLFIAFVAGVVALVASEELGAFAHKGRLFLNLIFAALLAALSVVIFWWCYNNRPHIDAVSLDYTLSFQCSWSKIPEYFREDDQIRTMQVINPPADLGKYASNAVAFMGSVLGNGKTNWAESFPKDIQRCDAVNTGPKTFHRVRMLLPVEWRKVIKTDSGTTSGDVFAQGTTITPYVDLAPGSRLTFYAVNYSTFYVDVQEPDEAVFDSLDETKTSTVKILSSEKNPRFIWLSPNLNVVDPK